MLLPSSTRGRAVSEGASSTYESLHSLPSQQSGGFAEELQLERMAAAGLRHKFQEAEAEVRAVACEGLHRYVALKVSTELAVGLQVGHVA